MFCKLQKFWMLNVIVHAYGDHYTWMMKHITELWFLSSVSLFANFYHAHEKAIVVPNFDLKQTMHLNNNPTHYQKEATYRIKTGNG